MQRVGSQSNIVHCRASPKQFYRPLSTLTGLWANNANLTQLWRGNAEHKEDKEPTVMNWFNFHSWNRSTTALLVDLITLYLFVFSFTYVLAQCCAIPIFNLFKLFCLGPPPDHSVCLSFKSLALWRSVLTIGSMINLGRSFITRWKSCWPRVTYFKLERSSSESHHLSALPEIYVPKLSGKPIGWLITKNHANLWPITGKPVQPSGAATEYIMI